VYDGAGRLWKERGRPGINREYRYDRLGRITEVRSGGEVTERYRYENRGRRIIFTDGTGEDFRREKNAYGELVTEVNRLKTALYPLTEEKAAEDRKEAEKAGLYFMVDKGAGEGYSFKSEELAKTREDLTSGMNLGYTGKPCDRATGLYNYNHGYRDYKPETARFTTVDPVRDGATGEPDTNSETKGTYNYIDPGAAPNKLKIINLLTIILVTIIFLGCDMNTTIRLFNEEARHFDRYYTSGKTSPPLEKYLRDGLIFHVYSPNDIPLDRFDIFASLLVWVTSTDNNISEIYITSCKIISDCLNEGQVEINEEKQIKLEEMRYGNLVFFKGYADLLDANIIDDKLKKDFSKTNKIITVEISVEYMKDNKITTTIISTKLTLKVYKSFVFWDNLMSV
jgi:RHS repeat-associated protein